MSRLPVLALDLVLIAVFAVIGRASHGSALDPTRIAQTAWPFLAAGVVGSLLASLVRGPWWRSGLVVWAVTVGLGVGLRLLAGETAQGAFVVVTAVVLAGSLLGWRLVASLLQRRATPARSSVGPA